MITNNTNTGAKHKFVFLVLMMYRSREKLNEAKSPLVMINGRGRFKNHVKSHTREAVLDRMQSSGNATGFATGCSVTHQLPWEQRAITGAFERFFSLLPPAGQTIPNSPGIGTGGELNLCPWPKASGCTGALGHSQSSTVGHRSSS